LLQWKRLDLRVGIAVYKGRGRSAGLLQIVAQGLDLYGVGCYQFICNQYDKCKYVASVRRMCDLDQQVYTFIQ
jgi:hypothetical protein